MRKRDFKRHPDAEFQPRQEVTRLRQIVVQVGMSGALTPVALLEPIDVGRGTVCRKQCFAIRPTWTPFPSPNWAVSKGFAGKKARKLHTLVPKREAGPAERLIYAGYLAATRVALLDEEQF